jgi:acyl-CoA thioester hydrolase
MTDLPITARGFVNTWQCDENAHLNVQFFTGWADEASPHLHALLGLDTAAQPRVRVVEDHIRYHREMLAADSVELGSAPVTVAPRTLVAYHEMRNAYNGEVAATICRTTGYASEDGIAADWPQNFQTAAELCRVELPANARPRTVGTRGRPPDLTFDQAEQAGAIEIVRGVVHVADCDASGRMTPRAHFGRFSDGAGNFWQSIGFDRAGMRDRNQGTVVVEMRCTYHNPPRAGDRIVVRSGLLGATERILHIVHFLFDAGAGRLAATAEGVGVLFDLEARRIVTLDAQEQSRLEAASLHL